MSGIPRGAAAVVLAAALLLSGCASTPPNPYATATAADLQQAVMHVTEAAGEGDLAAALTRLSELEVSTKVAHARGEITLARHDSILSAIALVRADLEALIAEADREAEQETARKAEEAERKAEEQARKQAAEAEAAADAERQAAERQAAERAAQQESAEERSTDDGDGGGSGKGKDNKGKGRNNGNGKGRG